jgi:hypothetical protein
MLKRLGRLFVIKSRFEAFVVIYALAVGGVERGTHYLQVYPGTFGYLLFLACTGTIFMAGAKILDAVPSRPKKRAAQEEPRQDDRRAGDRRAGDRRAGDRRQAPRERPA